MLIEFSVNNFGSYNEEQRFSMVADGASPLTWETGFNVCPHANIVAGIYGPNASGKSNLTKSMFWMKSFVKKGFSNAPEDEIKLNPFLLSKKSQKKPSSFEVTFIYEDTLYRYGFELDSSRVYKEWLYSISKEGQRQTWKTELEREYVPSSQSYNYKPSSLKKTWKTKRANALSLAVAAIEEDEKLAKDIYNWFSNYWRVTNNRIATAFTIEKLKDENYCDSINSLIKRADIGIKSFREIEIDEDESMTFPDAMPEELRQYLKSISNSGKTLEFEHNSKDENYNKLILSQQSDGTRTFLGLAGPIVDVLTKGYTLTVDELDRSLHPHLVMEIINLFTDRKLNSKGAQLIFTAHNTQFMDALNRDAIWITEKNDVGESTIKSILEYKPRAETSIQKNYNMGRYGGIPHITNLINK